MLKEPAFWVAVSFFGFLAMMAYFKVPALVGKSLDERATRIRDELDEARRLREEAQALLADYQRKQREADQEAEAIVANAKREAEAYAAEAKKALAESLERRTRLAEDKIARAEAQAMSDVRSAAVDAAIAAAEKVLRGKLVGADAAGLVDQSIRDLKSRLN